MGSPGERRCVVFDLDDTLFLERDYVRSGFRAVDAWLRGHHGVGGFFDRALRLFEAGQRGNIFDLSLPELKLDAEPALIREMVAVYRQHRPQITLTPDALEVLGTLHRGGRYRLAALTDGPYEAQRQKAAALRLDVWCAPIIYTDRWGRGDWKPSPRGYLVLQDHFDLPGGAFVYIADNPRKDFVTPRVLGWRTVRVRRPEGLHAAFEVGLEHDAGACVDSLHALPALVAGWTEGS
jgi:putative hydrolase of the HAD superfamily